MVHFSFKSSEKALARIGNILYFCIMKHELVDIHTHHPTEATTIRTVGLHPWHADQELPSEEAFSTAEAVGEIGLDKACEVAFEQQQTAFIAQLDTAERLEKPVVIHCVRAFNEVMQLLRKRKLSAVIFHGFIGSKEQAEEAIRCGFYLSFGARTARSPKTIEALRATPLDRLFIESDDDPTPIEEIYATIASLRGVTTEELQRATHENYVRLFQKQ